MDMFELLPPSTLFLPLFTPINLNAQRWQHDINLILNQDTLNYHMQQKNCISTPSHTYVLVLHD